MLLTRHRILVLAVCSRRKEGNVLFNDALNTSMLTKTFLKLLSHTYPEVDSQYLQRVFPSLIQTQSRDIRSGSRKEGNVLFNDALNTFYLRLYGVGDMVKDHSDSERGNPLPPASKGSFICTIPQTG